MESDCKVEAIRVYIIHNHNKIYTVSYKIQSIWTVLLVRVF